MAHDPRHLHAILVTVCTALMAVIASVSRLNVAQPQLATAFNASQGTVLWMLNLYTLTLAALLLPLGALGDRWGRRPVLLAGLDVFGLACTAAGLAPSAETMLAARFLSGVGAALIMPVTLAVITSTFPAEQRSKAISVWTGVAGGGGTLGMYFSAVLVDFAAWRWLFVLPLFLVLVAIVLTLRFIPNSREPAAHRFDVVGSFFSIVGAVGLVYALQEAPSQGLTSIPVFISLLGLGGFVWWEWRQAAPCWTCASSGNGAWPAAQLRC